MSDQPPILDINPPLINSSNPWATTLDDLRALFECASTGAVATRTSLIKGFDHDPAKHQYTFFGVTDHVTSQKAMASSNASLNTLGYSPILLKEYLGFIKQIHDGDAVPAAPNPSKGFIVSVTGTPEEVADCYRLIAISQTGVGFPLAMEVNLSCPNIPSKPPPAYSKDSLVEYIDALWVSIQAMPNLPRVPFGLKTPPYTHSTEFEALIGALEQSARRGTSPVSFLTATNTLGSCMVFSSPTEPSGPALPGSGIGGMAGAPLRMYIFTTS